MKKDEDIYSKAVGANYQNKFLINNPKRYLEETNRARNQIIEKTIQDIQIPDLSNISKKNNSFKPY